MRNLHFGIVCFFILTSCQEETTLTPRAEQNKEELIELAQIKWDGVTIYIGGGKTMMVTTDTYHFNFHNEYFVFTDLQFGETAGVTYIYYVDILYFYYSEPVGDNLYYLVIICV